MNVGFNFNALKLSILPDIFNFNPRFLGINEG
jgi:hypothetical protein